MRKRTSLGYYRETESVAVVAVVLLPDSAMLDAAFGCRERRWMLKW